LRWFRAASRSGVLSTSRREATCAWDERARRLRQNGPQILAHLLQGTRELVKLRGLVEKEIRAGFLALGSILHVGKVGQHDDFRGRSHHFQLAQHLDAIAPRHANVEDDDVGPCLANGVEGPGYIFGLPYHVYIRQVQRHGDQAFPHGGRIVANKDFELVHHPGLYTFRTLKSIGEGLIPL
jgi:hypothetical protein